MSLVVLSAAGANVALPALAGAFHATPAQAVRVVSAYQLALVMALLPCAALGESLGERGVFTAGVALFTGASLLCGIAPSLPWLVAARFVQGLGGAAVMALGVALLRFSVPQHLLAAVIGWNALTVALSSAAGPTVGAWVLSSTAWPWLFAGTLPLGLMVLLGSRALPAPRGSARRLDLLGMALNASAFAGLMASSELVPTRPALACSVLGAAAVAGAVLIRRELPKQAPLVPLDLLRARPLRIAVLASVACFAGQAAALVALPFFLQDHFGQDALGTGLLMTPWPLSVAAVAPLAGRLADRVSSAWLCASGGVCLALGLAALVLWPAHEGPLALLPFIMLCGAGFGLFQVPNNRTLLLNAPSARSGAAGALQGTARLAGQTAGSALMTLLFTLTSPGTAPRMGLAAGAVLTLAAGMVSTLRAGATEPEKDRKRAARTGAHPKR